MSEKKDLKNKILTINIIVFSFSSINKEFNEENYKKNKHLT